MDVTDEMVSAVANLIGNEHVWTHSTYRNGETKFAGCSCGKVMSPNEFDAHLARAILEFVAPSPEPDSVIRCNGLTEYGYRSRLVAHERRRVLNEQGFEVSLMSYRDTGRGRLYLFDVYMPRLSEDR